MQLEPSTTNLPTLLPDRKVDHFLLSTPDLIKLLAELVVMSRKATFDISLKDTALFTSFKYIIDPSSLNACLLQLSHNASSSLLSIYNNLYQIHKYIKDIQQIYDALLKIVDTTPVQLVPNLGLIESKALEVIDFHLFNQKKEINKSRVDVNYFTTEIIESIFLKLQHLESGSRTKLEQFQNSTVIAKLNLELIVETLNTTQTEFNEDIADYKKEFETTVSNNFFHLVGV